MSISHFLSKFHERKCIGLLTDLLIFITFHGILWPYQGSQSVPSWNPSLSATVKETEDPLEPLYPSGSQRNLDLHKSYLNPSRNVQISWTQVPWPPCVFANLGNILWNTSTVHSVPSWNPCGWFTFFYFDSRRNHGLIERRLVWRIQVVERGGLM